MAGVDGYTSVKGALTNAKKTATQNSFTDLFGAGATVPQGFIATPDEMIYGANTKVGSFPAPSYTAPAGGGAPAPSFPGAPTGPAAPVVGGAPGAPAPGVTSGGYTEDEIAAALASIEAEFGMTKEQLLADQSLVGAQYRLLVSRLNRQRTLSAMSVDENAAGRGIFRSSIRAENLANVEQQYQEQFGAAQGQQLSAEQKIQAQLAKIESDKAAAQAKAQADILAQVLQEKLAGAGV